MRIEQLTFPRFLAAISIVIFHYGKEVFPFNTDWTSFLFSQANVGVSFFFILSGFVMVIAYWKKEKILPGRYFLKRFARVYPVCLLAAILLLALTVAEYFLFAENSDLNFVDFFLSISLLQAWIPSKALSFNTPAWSITVECFFYLLFPLLFNRFYKKFDFKKLITPILLIWLFSQFLLHYLIGSSFYSGHPSMSHSLIFYFPLMHLNEFLLGNLAALFFIDVLKDKAIKTDIYILLILILGALALKFNTQFSFHNGLLAVLFVPLILFISSNKGYFSKITNRSFFVFLGEISYGVYILQLPVFMGVKGVFVVLGIDNPMLLFYAGILILLIVSFLSYKYVETPLRNKISALRV